MRRVLTLIAISLLAFSTSHAQIINPTGGGGGGGGSGITALTGDVTATGPGSAAATVAAIGGVAVGTPSGTGNVAFTNSPTFVSPTLGAAIATSINKITLTTPATGSTLTILDGKTATFNKSLTLAGTDATTFTFPTTSGTVMTTSSPGTVTATLLIGNSGNIQIGGSSATINITGTSAAFKFNSVPVAFNGAPTCTVPAGAGGTPICTLTTNVGSLTMKLTFSGGTGSFSGTTMTVTFPNAATNNGYLCDGSSGASLTALTNHLQTTGMTTTVTTLTNYNAAGTATAPGLTDVVVLKCIAS